MAETNKPQGAKNLIGEAAAAKLAEDNARVTAGGTAGGTTKPQDAEPPLAAEAAAAKLAQENASVTAAGTAAGAAQPRDTKNPLGEAVAAKLAGDTAPPAAGAA